MIFSFCPLRHWSQSVTSAVLHLIHCFQRHYLSIRLYLELQLIHLQQKHLELKINISNKTIEKQNVLHLLKDFGLTRITLHKITAHMQNTLHWELLQVSVVMETQLYTWPTCRWGHNLGWMLCILLKFFSLCYYKDITESCYDIQRLWLYFYGVCWFGGRVAIVTFSHYFRMISRVTAEAD